jgi:hypothetical protein
MWQSSCFEKLRLSLVATSQRLSQRHADHLTCTSKGIAECMVVVPFLPHGERKPYVVPLTEPTRRRFPIEAMGLLHAYTRV